MGERILMLEDEAVVRTMSRHIDRTSDVYEALGDAMNLKLLEVNCTSLKINDVRPSQTPGIDTIELAPTESREAFAAAVSSTLQPMEKCR